MMKDWSEYGYQYVELLWYDYNYDGSLDGDDAASFGTDFDFTTAQVYTDTSNYHDAFEVDGASPSISWIGPDMTVLDVDTTTVNASVYIEGVDP
ncbi:hypothetical protein L6R53_26970 [Myxococcota bacterium]|nr:hypothetical protein [Myxococcota bacterium]